MKRNVPKLLRPLLLVILFFMPLLVFPVSAAEKSYVLSYSPGTLFHQLVRDRTRAVYERAGMKAEFVPLPHNRSLFSANQGAVDGDVGRIAAVEEDYPNLRRINVKLMDLNGSAYTIRQDIDVVNADILTKYRVGYVLGVRWPRKKMKGLKATTAPDYSALFEMLLQNRIDIALATEDSANEVMGELGNRASKIRKLQPRVYAAPIYHYVHKKNEAIIPRLEKALAELSEEGYWEPPTEKTFVFYTGTQPPLSNILELRLQEAFRRIGKKSRLDSTGSAQRALLMANGSGDGDAMRISSIKKIAPELTDNLRQIPESIMDMKFAVYTKDKVFPIEGWESLKNYHNGLRGGVKILEENIPGKRTILPDSERLFLMLDQGRLDTVSEHSVVADHLIEKLKLSNIHQLSPALVTVPGYSYIHKKHQALISEIALSLAEMKADGSFDKIRDDVLIKINTP